MREQQDRICIIVTKDLDTEDIRISIQGDYDNNGGHRIAGPAFNNSNVEEILVEDITVSELLKAVKQEKVKREEYSYKLENSSV